MNPAGRSAASSTAAISVATVDLPFVPVTPAMHQLAVRMAVDAAARGPSTARGSSTGTQGTSTGAGAGPEHRHRAPLHRGRRERAAVEALPDQGHEQVARLDGPRVVSDARDLRIGHGQHLLRHLRKAHESGLLRSKKARSRAPRSRRLRPARTAAGTGCATGGGLSVRNGLGARRSGTSPGPAAPAPRAPAGRPGRAAPAGRSRRRPAPPPARRGTPTLRLGDRHHADDHRPVHRREADEARQIAVARVAAGAPGSAPCRSCPPPGSPRPPAPLPVPWSPPLRAAG